MTTDPTDPGVDGADDNFIECEEMQSELLRELPLTARPHQHLALILEEQE